jgi:uncharacterized protein (TIGR03435 family)
MKLLCAPLLLCLALSAQTPSFEVASIKPNRTADGSSSTRRGLGQVTMENVSLKKMTLMAYGIPDDREYALSGPDWLTSERFNVLAKYPADTPDAQVRAMLQNMLADRFKLALHKETRQLPTYALVLAKGGSKLKLAEGGDSRTNGRPGRLEATKTTVQKLADLLARMMGCPVLNETGLTGAFNFTLEWTPDETIRLGAEPPPPSAGGPSIFSALQEQLGLKLEGRKGPVDVLVVDRVERAPTEN